ncbi:Uncharacterized protein FWK35_00011911, partial [Aphis craccivora]
MKEKATCCVKCRRLVNVLTMREKRKNSGAQEHLLLSPSKRKLFNKIQNEKKCLKKKVIEEQLNNMSGINESQKTLIKECFATSKIKNTKIRRYSENWLMLCLLFNIRSPGAYKYLRDSQLLPLPHPKTVRQLLSSLKSTCGFDEDFISLLAKKVQHMSSMEKHGVLLFDEISLRISIQVSSSYLSYIGLEDHGNESTCHKEFADHALVFMWQSLGSNFSQTIGVFALKGDVKGIIVDGIVCDGATRNTKMWTELGINGTQGNLKDYFLHPLNKTRKIFAFSDFVHLIKCVRNRLYNSRSLCLHSDSDSVSWKYYEEV